MLERVVVQIGRVRDQIQLIQRLQVQALQTARRLGLILVGQLIAFANGHQNGRLVLFVRVGVHIDALLLAFVLRFVKVETGRVEYGAARVGVDGRERRDGDRLVFLKFVDMQRLVAAVVYAAYAVGGGV